MDKALVKKVVIVIAVLVAVGVVIAIIGSLVRNSMHRLDSSESKWKIKCTALYCTAMNMYVLF